MTKLDENSQSVQAHIGILQSVITRMSSNSAACKAWCITLVSAILVVVADKGKPNLTYLALGPTFLFFALDVYYLALEKGFRNSYSDFVKKIHAGSLVAADLFEVKPIGSMLKHQWKSIRSFSVWGFYLGLSALIWVSKDKIL